MDYPIKTLSQLRPILLGFRKAAGLTQAAMAAHLGVTQQTYAQLEANPAAVSVERLFRVLRVLQVDLNLTQNRPAQRVAVEDAAPPSNRTLSGRATRTPSKQGESVRKQARTQGPAQRATSTSSREAGDSTTAKAAKSARAAPKTNVADPSKKREDW
ncbi:helix-turn-helix domain-containing protein [Paraburkholderia sp. MMS20-SJTN17]|uniref:Helix-turn-helix domain-containing protein n=1 Tax=Paraburkholderia translucens TaxID=2886945 RepID=A0ABS8KCW6_9BURK|nr:helix-turn-helix transcriptional regulator [Paraburkholderia sp. MMS20-SJTN17]MCC8402611.1 helix-turn-helix domain-containing protein [Paraburkholderia sp. MMS20-SJTN17]